MSPEAKVFAPLLLFMVCAFGFGIVTLLNRGFDRGVVYPPYSSYRSDAHGTRAFYLSLDRLPATGVRRNFLQPARLSREKGATFFFLGFDVAAMRGLTKKDLLALESLAGRGNRLVFAFAPVSGAAAGATREEKEEGEGPGKERPRGDSRREGAPSGCLAWRWNFVFTGLPATTGGGNNGVRAVRAEQETDLPETIPVRSNLCFTADERFWRTVYSVDGKPVLVERDFGTGSIVLFSDASPVTNGALRDRPFPGLLLRLLGGKRTAVFDETHLGVVENPGVMSLLRKYRLTSFLGALLLLAGLFLWKNSLPLVRSAAGGGSDDSRISSEKDAMGGLVSLMRRHIPPARILDVCFREWGRSFSREFRDSDETRTRLQAIVDEEMAKPAAGRDPAAGYRRMARILAERK